MTMTMMTTMGAAVMTRTATMTMMMNLLLAARKGEWGELVLPPPPLPPLRYRKRLGRRRNLQLLPPLLGCMAKTCGGLGRTRWTPARSWTLTPPRT